MTHVLFRESNSSTAPPGDGLKTLIQKQMGGLNKSMALYYSVYKRAFD